MTRAGYFRIGLFVLGAIAIAVAFALAFGAGRWLRPKMVMETYFNESVQGIDVGSPIKYRGVKVGEVDRIGFTYTEYEQNKAPQLRKQYVMVEGFIQAEQVSGESRTIDPRFVQDLIGRGLRVQMAAQGLTGTYYLELDYVDPKSNPPLAIDWTPERLYIPSARSAVGQLMSGAEALMRKLDRANFDELIVNLNQMIVGITASLHKLEVDKLSSNTNGLVEELRRTNRQLQVVLAQPGWKAIPDELVQTLAEARKTVRSIDGEEITQSVVRLRHTLDAAERAVARIDRALAVPEADLPVIFDDLRQTTESLRGLAEELRRHPAALVFGQPPKPLPRPETARK